MNDARLDFEVTVRLQRGDFLLDVALQLPGQGISVVFGPSGCGKSSLLRAIAGLEPSARGTLRIGMATWQDENHRLPPHQRAVGMVFQHAALLPHLSVLGNLRYGWRRAGAPAAVLEEWIEKLALAPLLARRPASLSGGERQRVALGRALVCQPQCLLLDEPLSALDQSRREEILSLLETIRADAGIPMLHVTHAIDEAVRLADHLVLLEAGRVRASGPALELFNRPELPTALREDVGVVLAASLRRQHADGLLELATPAGPLLLHGPARAAGSALRVRIRARDVSLASRRHEDTSLLNLLPATVTALSEHAPGQVLVQLDAGGAPLLALISRRSAEHLQLRPGLALWAQIKAAALLA
jgi:molybdate transport system ATP-binding protein